MRRLLVALVFVITSSSLTGHAGQSSAEETDGVVYIASNTAGGNEILVFDQVTHHGSLEVISAAVPTTETAACWLVITENGRSAFTTNTGSGTVSALRIDPDGTLSFAIRTGWRYTPAPVAHPRMPH